MNLFLRGRLLLERSFLGPLLQYCFLVALNEVIDHILCCISPHYAVYNSRLWLILSTHSEPQIILQISHMETGCKAL